MSFHCVLLPAMFPIQSIQNLIVINTFVTRRDPSIRDILHCLPIRQWVEFKTCVLVNNCLHNISPSYLSSMCQPISKSTPAADTISCTRRPRRPGQKKQSATALVASPSQEQLRGTRCRHHSAMTNSLSLHFAVYSRLNFSAEHTTLL